LECCHFLDSHATFLGRGGGQVLPPSLPPISHTRLHDEEIECFFSYFWKDERCCFCRPVVLVCGFCAVRLACVVCLKEMAFNRGTKKKGVKFVSILRQLETKVC
jgi:hypothetical protein